MNFNETPQPPFTFGNDRRDLTRYVSPFGHFLEQLTV